MWVWGGSTNLRQQTNQSCCKCSPVKSCHFHNIPLQHILFPLTFLHGAQGRLFELEKVNLCWHHAPACLCSLFTSLMSLDLLSILFAMVTALETHTLINDVDLLIFYFSFIHEIDLFCPLLIISCWNDVNSKQWNWFLIILP